MSGRSRTQVGSRSRALSRRELLVVLGFGSAAAVVINGCTVPAPGTTPPTPPAGVPDPAPFLDGVKAGDPLPDRSVIWTRLQAPAGGADVPVLWTVADDDAFTSVRAGGLAVATAATGHTVTVPVQDLDPDRWYAYRFETTGAGAMSRTGRLRTAPAPAPARIASASPSRAASSSTTAGSWPTGPPRRNRTSTSSCTWATTCTSPTTPRSPWTTTGTSTAGGTPSPSSGTCTPPVPWSPCGTTASSTTASTAPGRRTDWRRPSRRASSTSPCWTPGIERLHRQLRWGTLADLTMIDVR